MGHYRANLRDLEFNLFEVLGLDAVLDSGAYGDLDTATVREILREVARLAEGPIAASFVAADRNPPRFLPDEHTIAVPDSVRPAVAAFKDAGWWRIGMSEAIGGMSAPAPLTWAVNEMMICANPAIQWYSTPLMSQVLALVGTEQQKQWARVGLDRGWTGTMALTEPDAGSDVGAGRTRAIPQPDGTWHIEGVKRFISGGDVGDTAENLFHLVLARPEGAGPGTKGLSLFYVPKLLFDPDTLDLRERNGVFATALEDKMGIKASPTCELTFGANGIPAVGYLVGDVHNGIAQMFKAIQYARMMVGIKSIGTLSTAYLHALDYAQQRVQGPDLSRFMDKTAPRVPITRHPDVRRSLMLQKAYAEGLRALYMYAAAYQYESGVALVDGVDADLAARVHDLLLPIIKGVGSEKSYQWINESLQTLGGSGFLKDYPIEQYIRDTRIDSLYEGTTAIQSLDFIFRKVARDRGVAFGHVAGQITTFIDNIAGDRFKAERALLAAALSDVQAMTGTLTTYLFAAERNPTELYKIGLVSVAFLHAVGDLLIGWRLLVQAEIAAAAIDAGSDESFYRGKIAAAAFFAKTILPAISATRVVVENVDIELMDVADDAF
ncbi:butyryl-CoA dehydrogenase [Mycobacterium sp. 1164966.3]|uniref:acyl-CoA dehydrogenase n=1 Tax=Mycobacterium sp. 1164966.3 TaxID=1856861 RepID=UPI0007FE7CBA|nr:acyl-CoA dehydrogenase [Mycobacterium sp. 1164966.3]OBA83552.1 butyryl-CoA dehydrogenase [Mycobacterium sp. 1164966.3]